MAHRHGLSTIWTDYLLDADSFLLNLNFLCFLDEKPLIPGSSLCLPRLPVSPPPEIGLASQAEVAAAAAAAAAAAGTINEVDLQHEASAASWVSQWCRPPFSSGPQMLSLLVQYHAKLLSSHCGLRRILRSKLETILSVSVITTPKGERETDPAKPCWIARRLWRLPVKQFLEDVHPKP